MIDLTSARRSEVLKLQFDYEDYNLFYMCLANVLRLKKNLAGPVKERVEKNVSDLDILLKAMREEGSIE